nr:HipA domain-containing protein [uncultured Tessaracoccus sp.]
MRPRTGLRGPDVPRGAQGKFGLARVGAQWWTPTAALRFDRLVTGEVCTRRHMEDFAQALGMPASKKYEVRAEQVLQLLGRCAGEDAQYGFIQRLAFNVHVGNADAHGKNYSIFLDDHSLTPLYDVVPVALFPAVDQQLAMKIGGARFSAEVQPTHWAKLARNTGLDPERAVHIAQSTVLAMLEHTPANLLGAVENASREMTRGMGV